MADDMMRFEITDEGIALMRNRAGYPNPTVRSGTRQLPWWTVTTPDAIRHFTNGYGDFYQPFSIGDYVEGGAGGVYDFESKESEFSGRSAIVTNRNLSWNQRGEVVSMGNTWFVHAARKKVSGDNKYAKDEAAFYSDEQLEEIEAAYDNESGVEHPLLGRRRGRRRAPLHGQGSDSDHRHDQPLCCPVRLRPSPVAWCS